MASLQQLQQEGACLRSPENIQPIAELTPDLLLSHLMRGAQIAERMPFRWSYIDKPSDGTMVVIYHRQDTPFPNDGIRYLGEEQKGHIREFEVHESKGGFIPNSGETTASRLRRRYRLMKGGNPGLVLVHYTRGMQAMPIPPHMNQPVRQYPLRPVNEPPMFVSLERFGQKVWPQGHPQPHAQGMQGPGPGPQMPQQIGLPMNMNQQQAMVAQQNSTMEALERRRAQERERERMARAARPPQPRYDDEESEDEVDSISARTLALTRYKRNHEWMNEVFYQAAYGESNPIPHKAPYSVFTKTELDEKTSRLQAEVEALQAKAAERRAEKIRKTQSQSLTDGDLSMNGPI